MPVVVGDATDPSGNVQALVEAAMERQDDLRAASDQRQDDLRLQALQHARELADVRSGHAFELRQIETARLNAIREVDNVAVQRASEVSATQAQTLAQTLAQTAEAMRTQVAAAATVASQTLDAKINPIMTAISDLQRFQFEAQGQRTQVVETREQGGSTGMWIGLGVSVVVGMIGFFAMLIAAAAFLLK